MTVLDAQQRARREVADDGLNQFIRRARVPNEIALEIWQRHLTIVDKREHELEQFRRGIRVLHIVLGGSRRGH
jgi:hypothetical protein